MLKFEFRKERLVHTPQIFLFKEFVDIIKSDRSDSKLKSNRMLYYIFLVCDLTEDNPVRDEPDKPAAAWKRTFGGRNKIKLTATDKKRIEDGMKKYIQLNTTAEERMLPTFDVKSMQLRNALNAVAPETTENVIDGVSRFTTNSPIIAGALSELAEIKDKRDTIVSAIRREALSMKIRGQVKLSPLSKGEITLYRDSDAKAYFNEIIDTDEATVIQKQSLSTLDQLKAERVKRRKKDL